LNPTPLFLQFAPTRAGTNGRGKPKSPDRLLEHPIRWHRPAETRNTTRQKTDAPPPALGKTRPAALRRRRAASSGVASRTARSCPTAGACQEPRPTCRRRLRRRPTETVANRSSHLLQPQRHSAAAHLGRNSKPWLFRGFPRAICSQIVESYRSAGGCQQTQSFFKNFFRSDRCPCSLAPERPPSTRPRPARCPLARLKCPRRAR